MSYEDLMARIAREIPELAGRLSAPRVTYVKSLQKTYITFESGVLAGEKQFLRLEKILRELFPGRPLSVRVVSRGLKDSFLEDPTPYRQVLDDFLRRNYPSAAGWVGQIDWQIEKNQLSGSNLPAGEEEALLTLVFPSEISLHVMAERNIGARLAQAVSDIFGARIRVEMTVAGDREERLRKLQAERRDAVLVVTREEMEKRAAEEAQKAAAAGGAGEKKAGPRKKTEAEGSAAAAAAKPIIGRSIGDKPVEIRELTGESGLTVIQGEISGFLCGDGLYQFHSLQVFFPLPSALCAQGGSGGNPDYRRRAPGRERQGCPDQGGHERQDPGRMPVRQLCPGNFR